MSDFRNPYQSPQASAAPETPAASGGILTDTMVRYLREASPWLRFIGILGFIGCAFMALGGIVMVASIGAMNVLVNNIPQVGALGSLIGAAFGGVMGVYCLGGALLVFFPSFFTYNFGAKISAYLRSGSAADLEEAFRKNKSLWKFIGILTIIELAFIPLMIVIGIIVAVATVF